MFKNVYKIIHRTSFNHLSSDKEHELVTSVEDYNVLMLTSCRFVDCPVLKWLEII